MDWPSAALGAGATLAMVVVGASPFVRVAMSHRAVLVAEIEKERARRVSAERGLAELLESVELLRQTMEKVARELAITLRDLMMARAENQCLRRDAGLHRSDAGS